MSSASSKQTASFNEITSPSEPMAHQHSYAVFVVRFKIVEFSTTNIENEICASVEPEHYVKLLNAQQEVGINRIDELTCIIVDSAGCIFSSSPSSTPSKEISAFPSSSSITSTSLDVDFNSSSSTSELSCSKSLISPNFWHISSVSSKQTNSFNDITSPSDLMGDSSYGAGVPSALFFTCI
uniref:Uncharacterized protein n=1 Tax=Glossina pallidipes TaxID=7398 RepID=A0A1B0AA91_GLOPL